MNTSALKERPQISRLRKASCRYCAFQPFLVEYHSRHGFDRPYDMPRVNQNGTKSAGRKNCVQEMSVIKPRFSL